MTQGSTVTLVLILLDLNSKAQSQDKGLHKRELTKMPTLANTKCTQLVNSDCTEAKVTHYGGNHNQYFNIPNPELNKTLYSTNCTQFPICENIGHLGLNVIASHALGVGMPSIRRGLYFICGDKAYTWLPANITGTCCIRKLAPALAIRKDTVRPGQSPVKVTLLVFKRDLFTKRDINLPTTDIDLLSEEITQLKKVVLEHRSTLNDLTAAQCGLCKVIHTNCCIYISNSEDIIKWHLTKIRELQNKARDIANDGWNPFKGLGGFGDFLYGIAIWLQKLGAYIVMFLFLILVIYFLIRLCFGVTTHCTSRWSTSPDEPVIVRKLPGATSNRLNVTWRRMVSNEHKEGNDMDIHCIVHLSTRDSILLTLFRCVL